IKFTDEGKVVVTISVQLQDVIDEDKDKSTYSQTTKKGNLLIELFDTGIGMEPGYIDHAWQSYSQGDMSITKAQDGTGLGLSICKNLVEINGGEIKVESQLRKGSKFWFTWNVELLSITPSLSSNTIHFDQISYILPNFIKQKRMLIIHPLEDARNSLLNYLKVIEKVDAFNTFDKENELAEKLIGKVGGTTSILHTPITWTKLINLFRCMEGNYSTIDKNNKNLQVNENILKRVADYRFCKSEYADQDLYKGIIECDSKINKCILCVDDNSISLENTLQKVSQLGYSAISATNGLDAVKLIDSKSKLLSDTYSTSFEVSQTIRAMNPPISNIPIIILTALPVEEIRNKCIESGINDYLAKPLKIEELENVLTKWIDKN
ncbi:24779_t:CDS:2, partial [Racocetra persica]